MARCIAVVNQKGGVGKTTTTINLAASLADRGQRVLLVDLDPQGNASTGSGVNRSDEAPTVCEWLLRECTFDAAVQTPSGGTYQVMPSDRELTAAELELLDQDGRERRLREQLQPARGRFDWILLDCPPALGILTVNALVAADGVLIPMQCEYYALEGLTALMQTIEAVRAGANPDLQIEGLIRTMYDPRSTLTRDVSRQLVGHFGDQLFRTVIPRNVRLAEAPSHGLPVLAYDRASRGSVAYLAMAAELLRRRESSH